MRERKVIIEAIVILCASLPSLADDMPNDLPDELAEYFDAWLCKDTTFIKCIGVVPSRCATVVTAATNTCDYSPIWREFQKRAETRGTNEALIDEGTVYAACINEYMGLQLHVNAKVYKQCLAWRVERYVEQVKKSHGKE